jgi:hypothetical protein
VDFVALSNRTFGVDNPTNLNQFRTGIGLPNSGPKVGPVVINEIMYHPISVIGTNTSENTDEEFIELFNITSNTVSLFDSFAATNHWKLGGGIDYTFAANVSLTPGTFLVVVGFDPATNASALANFRSKYGIGTNILIFGPYDGHLDNSGETVQLLQPDSPQTVPHPDAGFVPYVLVEAPTYTNALPWPLGANGTGFSLQRRNLGSYANDPVNWVACSPNPGTRNCVTDTDGDGLPDDWELANGLNPNSGSGMDGANGDPDQDGFNNYQEFLAGTDPHNAQSLLKFNSISRIAGGVALGFSTIAGHTYSIQYRSNLIAGAWQKLTDIGPFATNAAPVVNDVALPAQSARFYRLITPALP